MLNWWATHDPPVDPEKPIHAEEPPRVGRRSPTVCVHDCVAGRPEMREADHESIPVARV